MDFLLDDRLLLLADEGLDEAVCTHLSSLFVLGITASMQVTRRAQRLLYGKYDVTDDNTVRERFSSVDGSTNNPSSRVSQWTKILPKVWLVLLGLATTYVLYLMLVSRERMFFIYEERAVKWSDLWVSGEMKGLPPQEQLQTVDHICIISYAPQEDRRQTLTSMLEDEGLVLGIDFSFHFDWDRERVLEERELVARYQFTDAQHLERGENVRRYTLGSRSQRAFEDSEMEYVEVTEKVLGAIANFMQHRQCWEAAIKAGQSTLLVLEDDAFLVPWFHERFNRVMEQRPQNLDVLFVGSCLDKYPPKPYTQRISENLWHAPGHRCASGYLITRTAMNKLLDPFVSPPPIGMRNIDSYMEALMDSVLTDVFWVEPPLVFEGTKAVNPPYVSFRVGGSVASKFWELVAL
jgi:GR25 family glycosyltransferase involved in LPS biosynthesis